MTEAEEEIIRRLDLLVSTLRLAFADQLQAASATVRADDVSAAILDGSQEWTPSTALQESVAAITSKTARRVRDRLPELVAQGVLETRGSERKTEYRRTGLVV
jgi:hypothetical protein